ncbi:CHAT domain-containing tetratricopeptide repeat protein [Agromyces sp. NPDC004153]
MGSQSRGLSPEFQDAVIADFGVDAPAEFVASVVDFASSALKRYEATKKGHDAADAANALFNMDGFSCASALLSQALRIPVKTSSKVLPPQPLIANRLGEILLHRGMPNDARPLFEEGIALLEKTAVDHRIESAALHSNLAHVYSALDDPETAQQHLLTALQLHQQAHDYPWAIAQTLNALGRVEIELARASGPLYVNGFVNDNSQRHLRSADECFGLARETFESELPAHVDNLARTMLALLELATIRRDQDARTQLSTDLMQLAGAYELASSTEWDVLAQRAAVLFDAEHPERVINEIAERMAVVLPRLRPHEIHVGGLPTLFRAYSMLVDEHAMHLAQVITEIDERQIGSLLSNSSGRGLRAAYAPIVERMSLLIGHLLPSESEGEVSDWVYDIVVNRKGVVAEREGSAWLRARTTPERRAQFEEVRRLRSEVARVDLEGGDVGFIQDARERYRDAERELAKAEADLRPGNYTDGREWHVAVDEVRRSLPPDSMLVDLVPAVRRDGSEHAVAFIVSPLGGAPTRYLDLGLLGDVYERLNRAADLLSRAPQKGDTVSERLAELASTLPPLFAQIWVTPQVLIAPSGVWSRAPFSTFLDATARPLIERTTLSLVPSARWLTRFIERGASNEIPGTPLVIGDADFDAGLPSNLPFFMSMRVSQLPHTRTEAEDIATMLGIEPVLGPAATRTAVLQVVRPRVLHIASHGTFLTAIGSLAEQAEPRASVLSAVAGVVQEVDVSLASFGLVAQSNHGSVPVEDAHRRRVTWLTATGPSSPSSRSVLLLAGFNAWVGGSETPADIGNGMLSASEFALLELDSTDLVVLSACNSGAGAVDFADGSLLGLRTAALAAGATGCVSTLWEVPDASTAQFMQAFYRLHLGGEGSARALRQATLELRERYPDPFFWAPWVYEGGGQSR